MNGRRTAVPAGRVGRDTDARLVHEAKREERVHRVETVATRSAAAAAGGAMVYRRVTTATTALALRGEGQ